MSTKSTSTSTSPARGVGLGVGVGVGLALLALALTLTLGLAAPGLAHAGEDHSAPTSASTDKPYVGRPGRLPALAPGFRSALSTEVSPRDLLFSGVDVDGITANATSFASALVTRARAAAAADRDATRAALLAALGRTQDADVADAESDFETFLRGALMASGVASSDAVAGGILDRFAGFGERVLGAFASFYLADAEGGAVSADQLTSWFGPSNSTRRRHRQVTLGLNVLAVLRRRALLASGASNSTLKLGLTPFSLVSFVPSESFQFTGFVPSPFGKLRTASGAFGRVPQGGAVTLNPTVPWTPTTTAAPTTVATDAPVAATAAPTSATAAPTSATAAPTATTASPTSAAPTTPTTASPTRKPTTGTPTRKPTKLPTTKPTKQTSGRRELFFTGITNAPTTAAPTPFPTAGSLNWASQQAVGPVLNQGSCGGCWAFATATVLQSRYYVASGSRAFVQMSEQSLISCAANQDGCNGGNPATAMVWVVGAGGLTSYDTYPYTSASGVAPACNQAAADQTLIQPQNVPTIVTGNSDDELIQGLANGPVTIAVWANNACFKNYAGGVLMASDCPVTEADVNSLLDHAITLVGYTVVDGVSVWVVQNSWGTSWGNAGLAYLQRGVAYPGTLGLLAAPAWPIFVSPSPACVPASANATVPGYCAQLKVDPAASTPTSGAGPRARLGVSAALAAGVAVAAVLGM